MNEKLLKKTSIRITLMLIIIFAIIGVLTYKLYTDMNERKLELCKLPLHGERDSYYQELLMLHLNLELIINVLLDLNMVTTMKIP